MKLNLAVLAFFAAAARPAAAADAPPGLRAPDQSTNIYAEDDALTNKVFIGDTPMKLTPTLGAGSCYTPVQLMPAGTQECPLGTAKITTQGPCRKTVNYDIFPSHNQGLVGLGRFWTAGDICIYRVPDNDVMLLNPSEVGKSNRRILCEDLPTPYQLMPAGTRRCPTGTAKITTEGPCRKTVNYDIFPFHNQGLVGLGRFWKAGDICIYRVPDNDVMLMNPSEVGKSNRRILCEDLPAVLG